MGKKQQYDEDKIYRLASGDHVDIWRLTFREMWSCAGLWAVIVFPLHHMCIFMWKYLQRTGKDYQ